MYRSSLEVTWAPEVRASGLFCRMQEPRDWSLGLGFNVSYKNRGL